MKVSFFSDLHISDPNGFEQNLFNRFCGNPYTQEATHIVLLGDMFDLMVGEHGQYIRKYAMFFENIVSLLEKGKKIVYIEGNHDFHIGDTIDLFLKSRTHYSKNFTYLTQGKFINLGNKKFYICHGHEVDYNNDAFKRWYRIYNSYSFKMLVNKILPYSFIEYAGDRASKNSKNRGSKSFNLKQAKAKYIAGAKSFMDEIEAEGVICGHTHIQENHAYPDGTRYINCGHPKTNLNFLHYSDEAFKFVSLAES